VKNWTSTFRRQLLPWLITAGALGYVFGYAIDWAAIPAATERANLPLFIGITVFDKIAFFLFWGFIQAGVIRKFIEPVPIRDVLQVKGGAELVRTVNNGLADAAFLYGLSLLVPGRLAAVVMASSLPFACHFGVLLLQATLSLLLLPGGVAENTDVATGAALGWTVVAGSLIAGHFGLWRRLISSLGLATWFGRVRFREILPFVGWFVLFAIFDVLIQGLASRSFGVPIPAVALMARIPILYVAISIPSLGNFGTREIAWANLFEGYGEDAALYAFALWTNVIFLLMHALIGGLFFSRAVALVRGVRLARREGEEIREPLLRDAADR
jgi:hypothetical protein